MNSKRRPASDTPKESVDHAHLRRVLESAPLVLWAVDSDGVFTLSEGRGLVALGLKPGEVVGQSVFEMYAESQEVTEYIKRGLGGEEFTNSTVAGDRHFESRYTPIRDDDGEVVGLLGISIDMTERQRAEAEKESLQAQLLQAQKLESLGLLAGGIAHDFNNILTVILGNAANAMRALEDENSVREDIEGVLTAAERAAELTRQLLAYAGKGKFELKAISLSTLSREMATLMEATISNKKIEFRLDLKEGLPTVEADVAQIRQVVMNLVINATEAIGESGGSVSVSTGTQEVDVEQSSMFFGAEDLEPGIYV
jgi:two-component system, cell cycle sensor histidine kinase and response regulator CckA